MADNDDHDNVVPFGRAQTAQPEEGFNMTRDDLTALMEKYNRVAIVGWNEEEGLLDIISPEHDSAALYELLQEAAGSIALEAIEASQFGTRH